MKISDKNLIKSLRLTKNEFPKNQSLVSMKFDNKNNKADDKYQSSIEDSNSGDR